MENSEMIRRLVRSRLAIFISSGALAILIMAAWGALLARAESKISPIGSDFWKLWGDGKAELAGYELTYPRYGHERKGTAVTIFVTETFSNAARVKSDPGKHAASDEFPVMKLNLIQDFATGIYDYNLMTSVFVALQPVNGRPIGAPTKVTFSSQEWCGQVFHELLFDEKAIREVSHSYFDGEADRDQSLVYPADGISEDALLLWARGLATPRLEAGESREVPLLRSVEYARLRHTPVDWTKVTLSRSEKKEQITVPAGTFEAELLTAAVEGGRRWFFHVEAAEPHRILKWETDDGLKAELLASDRLQYWKMNGPDFAAAVEKLGLSPRPTRTP